jgi:hypothetical protein
MNERFKTLWFEAAESKNGDSWEEQTEFMKKFTELIVRECARVIDRGDGEMSSMDETIWCNVCRDDILEHFGVEE